VRPTFAVIAISWLLSCCSSARAQTQSEPGRQATVDPISDAESRWNLGVRGLGGGLFSEDERRGGGGGSLLVAFGVVPERWEIELGLSLIGARDGPLGVFEVVGKRIFERRGKWAPHLLLGPAFSLDFGDEAKPSGGMLLGTGVTHWFAAGIGWTGDAAYRLLIGSEVEHVLTLALGLAFRL
jgi:hypothetical protein